MKLLYTQGTLVDAGHKILVRATSIKNVSLTLEDQEFEKAFPEVKTIVDKVFDTATTVKEFEAARLGDIVWVETSGGKLVANCIVFDENDDLNYAAAKRALEVVYERAVSLEQPVITTNLFGGTAIGKESKSYARMRWQNMCQILETLFEDIQVIVFIPDQQDLVEILDSLGSYKKIYDMPVIRFRHLGDKSDK
jgi:hypothetical protein